MYAAQEMFKTANKVTRPEKALILGFMAGSRGAGISLSYVSISKCTWSLSLNLRLHICTTNTCRKTFCTSSHLCREPVPGAGGHHPDQAERAHRGSAQSRRHRQHHHVGGHGLRNELLHRAVDPPQEIQTHHKYILRRFTCSKPHTHTIS